MKNIIFLILLIPAFINAQQYNCADEPECYENLTNTNGVVSSDKELQAACKGYEAFTRCIDNYGRQCWGPNYEEERRKNILIARPLVPLCTQENFRSDYVKEFESFSKIKIRFAICDMNYHKNTLRGIFSSDESVKLKNSCCAAQELEKCVDEICIDKCTPGAMKILDEIVDLQATVPGKECNKENRNKDFGCPSGTSKLSSNVIYLVIFMIIGALFH